MKHSKLVKITIAMLIIALTIISIWQKYEFYTMEHKKPSGFLLYTVEDGDCIEGIARKYKPKYKKLINFREEIQYINNTNEIIYPGSQLIIPVYKGD